MSEASTSTGRTIGPIETSMREKLTARLNPVVLDITNDSHLHRHHAAMKSIGGGSGETHFSVRVVSDGFIGKPTIARHRLVYQILDHELTKNAAGIHALSLKTLTSQEYENST
ncbi:bolA protein [Puccinia sorghi]|uniref:BolA protein n=1 Tax=Puccinia sorghi TaxID=27349 RepID=A0A0L6V756_9BASI|nr:bolA protein [Puccinia sorghi]